MSALHPTGPTTHAYDELVEDAVRAPSPRNTQPWRFRELPDAVELHADLSRALPVNDPAHRELLISCGTALANLCASAEHHHLAPRVELFPDEDERSHVATVHLTPTPAYTDARLSYGIRLRTTWRDAFADRPVPERVVTEMLDAAHEPGVWAAVVDDDDLPEVLGLITSGDHFQYADDGWRHEVARWLHPRSSGDGLVVPRVAGALSRFLVSHLDLGERTARDDVAMTESAPVVVVLGTEADDETGWVHAGMALERLLLTGAVQGVQAMFSNQPCQVPVLRPLLASVLGHPHPQVLLRLGYPPEAAAPTPRRSVEAVLDE